MYLWPLFTKRTDVLQHDLVKSRSRKIGCYHDRVALNFDRHLGCAAPEAPANFWAIGKVWNWISRLRDSTRSCDKSSVRLVNKGPGLEGRVSVSGKKHCLCHYSDVIMSAIASQITGVLIVYSTVGSGADQRKFESSAPLAFVRGIHRWPVNYPHKGPVKRKCFQLMTSSFSAFSR